MIHASASILQGIIDGATSPWGIKVSIVEVKDVEIPADMQRAMARQAEAERERRANVIAAEGEFQASERLKDAAHIMAQEPITVQLRYLQTLLEIGSANKLHDRLPDPRRTPRSGSTEADRAVTQRDALLEAIPDPPL